MRRQLNLRQIEAFKAVIEHGTVSRAAEVLNVSQPALSKLVAHLESDTGLRLFDRVKRRLAPTDRAMRLYAEVGRIFAGVRQVESAVEVIRREEQGRLAIGVIPAMSGGFIRDATAGFLADHPNVFCSIDSISSQWIVDRVLARQLDVGLVGASTSNPYVVLEPLMEHQLVCVAPRGHVLAARDVVRAEDLDDIAFVALPADGHVGRVVDETFRLHGIQPDVRLVADTMPILCEFVAGGLGVSLVHPLVASGWRDRLVVRPFEPAVPSTFQICWSRDSRNSDLVVAFVDMLRATARVASERVFAD